MTKWFFFGLGCYAMFCTILGWCCVHVGAQAEREFEEHGEW